MKFVILFKCEKYTKEKKSAPVSHAQQQFQRDTMKHADKIIGELKVY